MRPDQHSQAAFFREAIEDLLLKHAEPKKKGAAMLAAVPAGVSPVGGECPDATVVIIGNVNSWRPPTVENRTAVYFCVHPLAAFEAFCLYKSAGCSSDRGVLELT